LWRQNPGSGRITGSLFVRQIDFGERVGGKTYEPKGHRSEDLSRMIVDGANAEVG
jgi:hypothetical protein